MNNYIQSAVNRYRSKINEEYNISPISQIDAEIFVLMYELIKKAQISNNLVDKLSKYKFLKDEEIKESLIGYNLNYAKLNENIEEFEEEEDEESPRKTKQNKIRVPNFVLINNSRYSIAHIFGYEAVNKETKHGETYFIKLNPTPLDVTSVPIYSNHLIEFWNETDRDLALENIDIIVQNCGGKILDVGDYKSDI